MLENTAINRAIKCRYLRHKFGQLNAQNDAKKVVIFDE